MVVLLHYVAEESKLRYVVPHDPMGSAIRQIETVTRTIFRQLIDALAAGEEDESSFRVGPHENVDAGEVPSIAPPKNARTVSPGKAQESSGKTTVPKSSHETSSNLDAVQRVEVGPPRENTIFRGPGRMLIVTTSQQARISLGGGVLPPFPQCQKPSGRGRDDIIEGTDYPRAHQRRAKKW